MGRARSHKARAPCLDGRYSRPTCLEAWLADIVKVGSMTVVRLDGSCVHKLPQEPQLMSELATLLVEDPEERFRRLEWIRHYIREKKWVSAWDLGWDGQSFANKRFEPPVEDEIRVCIKEEEPVLQLAAPRSDV